MTDGPLTTDEIDALLAGVDATPGQAAGSGNMENEKVPLENQVSPDLSILKSLDSKSIQDVIRSVGRDTLAMALKSVEQETQDLIFNNMTKIGAKILKEDMIYMGPVRLRDVQAAQREVIKYAHHILSIQKTTFKEKDMDPLEFEKEYYAIFNRAMFLSEKARSEGLLALEEEIDPVKFKQRDIFEFGLRIVVDGTDSEILDKILSNIINLEADQDKKTLKTIQKEAVLEIQAGGNSRFLALLLNSYVNFGFEEATSKFCE